MNPITPVISLFVLFAVYIFIRASIPSRKAYYLGRDRVALLCVCVVVLYLGFVSTVSKSGMGRKPTSMRIAVCNLKSRHDVLFQLLSPCCGLWSFFCLNSFRVEC